MAITHYGAPIQWVPELVAAYVHSAMTRESIAHTVCEGMITPAGKVKIPTITSDPVATFGTEGDELNVSDPGLDGIEVVLQRVGVVTKVSREFFDDQVQIAGSVTEGQGRDIARRIDQALFTEPAPGGANPAGLASINLDATEVEAGATWTDVDPFTEAQGNAEGHGATITSWVANSATARTLGTLKTNTSDSNLPLLGSDPTLPGKRAILGAPVYVSDYVSDGVVWGIPKQYAILIDRGSIESAIDESVFFTSFNVALRSVARVGFAFPYPAAVQRVALDAALVQTGS